MHTRREFLKAGAATVAASALTAEQVRKALQEAERRERRKLLKALAPHDLASFVELAWEVLEPGVPLVWNWHIDLLCDVLQRQIEGDPDYRKLLICIPPGMMKSLLVSVMAPAWEWLRDPSRSKLVVTNDQDLADRDADRFRLLVQSDLYRELQAVYQLGLGQSPETAWRLRGTAIRLMKNTGGGFRISRSLYGRLTGKRAADIIVDDPLDAQQVVLGSIEQVAARVDQANRRVGTVLPSRVNDQATARWTLIMQRLHEDDPASKAIEEGGWHVVIIPMEFEPGAADNHPQDPRTEPGELAFPAKFPRTEVDALKGPTKLGTRHYSAQYQQRPTPAGGLMFKRHWFQRYDPEPWVQARRCEELVITVDCAAKKGAANDYSVLQVWGVIGANRYLIDQVKERMEYTELKATFLEFVGRWRIKGHTLRTILVEDASNGVALLSELRGKVPGMVGISPGAIGGKVVRARWTESAAQARQIFLPLPRPGSTAPGQERLSTAWVDGWLEEHASFPAVSHDDQVDATSQLMHFLSEREEAEEDWDVGEEQWVAAANDLEDDEVVTW